MTVKSKFQIGDSVEPTPENKPFFEGIITPFEDGTYKVSVIQPHYIQVTDKYGHLSPSYWATRFQFPATKRVEGKEIKPADIKVGDEVLVTMSNAGITHTRQAVVHEIKRQTDTKNFGTLLFFAKDSRGFKGSRLNWGKDHPNEAFTLVKAAPERDVLLDRLTGALAGQVITFRETWARKHGDEMWDVVVKGRLSVLSTDNLRCAITSSPVTFLKAE